MASRIVECPNRNNKKGCPVTKNAINEMGEICEYYHAEAEDKGFSNNPEMEEDQQTHNGIF